MAAGLTGESENDRPRQLERGQDQSGGGNILSDQIRDTAKNQIGELEQEELQDDG